MPYPMDSDDMHSLETLRRLIAVHRERYRTEGGEERKRRIAELEQNADKLEKYMVMRSEQKLPLPGFYALAYKGEALVNSDNNGT